MTKKKTISQATIKDVVHRLVKAYHPLQVYLFGSYAWGTPDEESDLDILIVVEKSELKTYKRPLQGYDALEELRIAPEIIVYTKDEFEKRSNNPTTLAHKIKSQGEQLYARA